MTLCIYDIVRLGGTPGGSIELEVQKSDIYGNTM